MDLIHQYCKDISTPESEECREIRDMASERFGTRAGMISGPHENALLKLLITLMRPKRVLEVGTFVGYSALSMAEALGDGAKITTLDISSTYVDEAKKIWAKSSHGHKIESLIKPALDYLKETPELFDLIFIDADKNNYLNYFELALDKLAPNGLIAIDNTLWSGRVLEENPEDLNTRTIKAVNEMAANRSDLVNVLIPIRDGLHLVARKN